MNDYGVKSHLEIELNEGYYVVEIWIAVQATFMFSKIIYLAYSHVYFNINVTFSYISATMSIGMNVLIVKTLMDNMNTQLICWLSLRTDNRKWASYGWRMVTDLLT